MLGVAREDVTSGQVFDLSATGVGIIAEQPFPANRVLVLRLPTTTQGWSSHLVRIKHCAAVGDGVYQVGCAFIKPLSVSQLQSLLGLSSEGPST
jgi:hypothetical protein